MCNDISRSIDEVINELERKRPANVDITDVASALDTPESQAEFMVITDDDVLEAMLSAPMEQWRVFRKGRCGRRN